MSRKTFLAIMAVAIALPAVAQGPQGSPKFNLAEEVVIARNDVLTSLLSVDPWGVRKVLDAVDGAKQRPPTQSKGSYRDVSGGLIGDGSIQIDPQQNPDIDLFFQRASPEAVYDIFQILKQAAKQSGTK
jgi:hypothetical protein